MKWAVSGLASTLLVSTTGRVIRMASSRRKGSGWQTFPELELSPRRIGAGYMAVGTKENGIRRTLYLHRLVAEAFLGMPPYSNEVNHLDGDKTNNRLENLEWVTHSENHQHAAYAGLSNVAKLTPKQVWAVRELIDLGLSDLKISKRFGMSRCAVSEIRTGRTWAWLTVQASLG